MNEDLYQLSQEVSTASDRYRLALSDLAYAEEELLRLRGEFSTKRHELRNLEAQLALAGSGIRIKRDHANLCGSMLKEAEKELREFTQESEDNKKGDPGPESMTAEQRNNSGVYEIFLNRRGGGLLFGLHRPPTC